MFLGYNPLGYKLFVWTLSAVLCGIAGALYVPQVGIINPMRNVSDQFDRNGDMGCGRRTGNFARADPWRILSEWRKELSHGVFRRVLVVLSRSGLRDCSDLPAARSNRII